MPKTSSPALTFAAANESAPAAPDAAAVAAAAQTAILGLAELLAEVCVARLAAANDTAALPAPAAA